MMKYAECKRGQYTLRGMLHIPEGASESYPVPLVIILNGFTADRCDGFFINVALSRLLCEHGIASARFDFMGSGESDGQFQDMSILTETEDTEVVLKYVQSLPYVDSKRIALHGLSQGGLVAFLTAARHPEEIACVGTWSPALVIPDCCKEHNIQGIDIQNIEETGWVDFHGVKLGKQYYLDGISCDIYKEAAKYKGPVQIVHGTSDQIVPYQYAEKMKEILGDSCTLYLYDGMSHFADGLKYNELRYQRALDFLSKELLPDHSDPV